jgi:hypothetical protein
MFLKKINERLNNLEERFSSSFMNDYLELMDTHSKYLVNLYATKGIETPFGPMFASLKDLKIMRDFCDKAIKEIEE